MPNPSSPPPPTIPRGKTPSPASVGRELDIEPQRLREHYRVTSQRIETVGLVYLVPETR
jgi:hypothetical protein